MGGGNGEEEGENGSRNGSLKQNRANCVNSVNSVNGSAAAPRCPRCGSDKTRTATFSDGKIANVCAKCSQFLAWLPSHEGHADGAGAVVATEGHA
jgi:hypothetical protein